MRMTHPSCTTRMMVRRNHHRDHASLKCASQRSRISEIRGVWAFACIAVLALAGCPPPPVSPASAACAGATLGVLQLRGGGRVGVREDLSAATSRGTLAAKLDTAAAAARDNAAAKVEGHLTSTSAHKFALTCTPMPTQLTPTPESTPPTLLASSANARGGLTHIATATSLSSSAMASGGGGASSRAQKLPQW